jgi:hypothetical protein
MSIGSSALMLVMVSENLLIATTIELMLVFLPVSFSTSGLILAASAW